MLHHIVLHLARTHEFPEGSSRHGYEMIAPLDAEGRLDFVEWCSLPTPCRVRRFWADEPERSGVLVHRRGGAGGATWVVDYDRSSSEDDETGYRFDTHTFRIGDYVSMSDAGGFFHTFKVAEVKPLTEQPARAAQ